jgi:hypothetical protein
LIIHKSSLNLTSVQCQPYTKNNVIFNGFILLLLNYSSIFSLSHYINFQGAY